MGIKGWPCSPPSLGRCHEPLHCHLAMNNGTGFRGIDEQTALLMERRHTILAAWLHETPNRRPQSRPLTRMVPSGFASVNTCDACWQVSLVLPNAGTRSWMSTF